MAEPITVEIIDQVKELVQATITRNARWLPNFAYADIRLEASEGQGAAAENGNEKSSSRDYGLSFGIRVLAGDTVIAPGYFGQQLGSSDIDRLARTLRTGLRHAYERAVANARLKADTIARFDDLGRALASTELAPIPIVQDTVPAVFRTDPRDVPLEQIVAMARETSRAVQGVSPAIQFNFATAGTMITRQLFCSSEGAVIDQSWALSEGFVYVVAATERGDQEIYDFMGHQQGWEVMVEGVNEDFVRFPTFQTFATDLAQTTAELADAPQFPTTDGEVVVVTDPHYNALVAHEVVGHPTELDRALKWETSYAGRSWLLRTLQDNQLGKQIASPLVSAYSDPAMPGFGFYRYDDEGTPGQRVMLIDKGIFSGFMNSRQTAGILGAAPNGSAKATDASLVPLIRMSNTVLGNGDRDPQGIIREVDRGYYVVGHRIPSVAESRENFRISAMKVYEIRNGELGQLYRNGAIMSDTRDYFMNVDAVGNDFRLFAIPNCGKGQPMQTKRMGNGGPTMRSRARLTGG